MSVEDTSVQRLDRLSGWIRSQPLLLRATYFTRISLAAGFVPTGMVKLLGRRFTTISVETPGGALFEALYQAGPYWRFIGAAQILAGILLLIPRLAHLGAALFLPIIANIFVITIAIDFHGTPLVTGLMLLATIYLCMWDYPRFRGLLTPDPPASSPAAPTLVLDPLEAWGFAVFAVAMLGFFGQTRGFAAPASSLVFALVGCLAGVFTLARFATTGRKLL